MGYFQDLIEAEQIEHKEHIEHVHETFFSFLRAVEHNERDIVNNGGVVEASEFSAKISFPKFLGKDSFMFYCEIAKNEIMLNKEQILSGSLMAKFQEFLGLNAKRIAQETPWSVLTKLSKQHRKRDIP